MFLVEIEVNVLQATTEKKTYKNKQGVEVTSDFVACPAVTPDGSVIILAPPFGKSDTLKVGKCKVKLLSFEQDRGVARGTFLPA